MLARLRQAPPIPQLTSKLDRNRTDTTRPSDDQQHIRGTGNGTAHIEPVEQRFPGGDRGQGQGRCLCPVEAPRLSGDDPFIDDVKFSVCAFARDTACVKDLVPGQNPVTLGPTVLITPAASQPNVFQLSPAAEVLWRTFTSTGVTDTALTSTSRSRLETTGSGSSLSKSESGRSGRSSFAIGDGAHDSHSRLCGRNTLRSKALRAGVGMRLRNLASRQRR